MLWKNGDFFEDQVLTGKRYPIKLRQLEESREGQKSESVDYTTARSSTTSIYYGVQSDAVILQYKLVFRKMSFESFS